MIDLITYKAGFGQPSFSPFCVKAMWLLQAAGSRWQRVDSSDPRKMPYAKLPVIKVDGQTIGDSHNIQTFLETQGADLWSKTTPGDRAIGHAFMRMAEEHIYFHLVLDRWENEQTWRIVQAKYFSDIPRLLRGFVSNSLRKALLKGLKMQGLGRFNATERLTRIELDLSAIAQQIDAKPFLLGDQPTPADFSVAAMLGALMAAPVPTLLSQRVANDAHLVNYTARVATRMGVV